MGWFSNKLNKDQINEVANAVADKLKLAIQREDPDPKELEQVIKENRRQPQPVVFYSLPGRKNGPSRALGVNRNERGVEIGSPYDLAECIKLQDIESYFSTSVDRHVELIMKDGYYLEGQNPETIAYVEKRLDEIALISGQPFDDIVRELIRNVVVTANGFLVLKRDPTRSSGRRIRMWGKELEPISAVYVPDPSSVTCKQNKTGHIYQWIQQIEENKKYWPYHDVIHIPVRKKSSFVFGTPYVIPVLEDIKALRKLEMLTEHLAHKFAFPLMHWKVGTEERPADMIVDPSTGIQAPEIEVAENVAKLMAQEGFACTSERHEIKFLGAEGETLDISPFVKHYEMRVLGGLRLSEIDLGRGDTSNRGTAKVISQILADACREIQETVRSALNTKLLNILVLEGGFDLSPENRVMLNFPPIDKEEERAQEMHGLVLYQSGAIDVDELRQEYLGRNPLAEEQVAKTFLNVWLIPLAEATAEAKAAAKPATGTNKASQAVSIAMPTNQYGTTVKPKLPANDAIALWMDCAKNVMSATKASADARPVINQALAAIAKTIDGSITDAWEEGFNAGLKDAKADAPSKLPRENITAYMRFLKHKDLQSLTRLCLVNAGINTNTGMVDAESRGMIMGAFEATTPLLASKIERAIAGAKKIGYLDAANISGHTSVYAIEQGDSSTTLDLTAPGVLFTATNPTITDVKITKESNEQAS